MMEKKAIVEEGVTPPEKPLDYEKFKASLEKAGVDASSGRTVEKLDDHTTTRLAKQVEEQAKKK